MHELNCRVAFKLNFINYPRTLYNAIGVKLSGEGRGVDVQTEKVGLQVLLELAEREEAESKKEFLDLLALELWERGIRIVFGIYHAYYYKDPKAIQIESIKEEIILDKGKTPIYSEDEGSYKDSYKEKSPISPISNNKIELPLKSKCVVLKVAKMEPDEKETNRKLFKNEELVLKHFSSKYKQNGDNICYILRMFASDTEHEKHPKLVLELAEKSLENYWEGQKNNVDEHPSIIKNMLNGIHLDLKLDNFMFVKDNGEGNEHLKLIDFGSSMLLQEGKTYRFKSLALDSDIGYRSPEHKMNTGIRGYMVVLDKLTSLGAKIWPLCLYVDPNYRPSAENLISFMKNECTMRLPNGKQISFNPEVSPPKEECKPSRVTREPAVLKTRRLFTPSKSNLSPRSTI
uniref:Protein kinase domain-containing protein n=1 Tax=Meloidogyne javanica TaxID=6303 RepID=A0A915NAD9_MELJA